MRNAFLVKDGIGGWIAEEPTLPGCVVGGKTPTEVQRRLQVAVQSAVDQLQASGQPIPPAAQPDPERGILITLYLRDDVTEAIKQTFPGEDPQTIHDLLDEYGTAKHENEKNVIHLAILELSQGDSNKLLRWIREAKKDYRDVLVARDIERTRKKNKASE